MFIQKRAVFLISFLILLIIVISPAHSTSHEETAEEPEAPAYENPDYWNNENNLNTADPETVEYGFENGLITADNIGDINPSSLAEKIDKVNNAPEGQQEGLIGGLSDEQISEIGGEKFEKTGLAQHLDENQIYDNDIYDDIADKNNLGPGVNDAVLELKSEFDDVSVQGVEGQPLETESAGKGQLSIGSVESMTVNLGEQNVESSASEREATQSNDETESSQTEEIGGATTDIGFNPTDGTEPSQEESVSDEESDDDRQETTDRRPTSISITGGNNIQINGDTITADSADQIILTTRAGNVEISSDVEDFNSDSSGFSVGSAQRVSVDGIQFEDVKDTRFSRTNNNGISLLQVDLNGILNTIDKAGTGSSFITDDEGGTLMISFDDVEVDYVLDSGQFNITPDVPSAGETYTESIDAQGSKAQAKITKAQGVTYLKLSPPASYRYTPESLEKTFALQAQHKTHEVFFSKGGERPKNDCQQCTIVDFVDNMIKIHGQLTYKRFFFTMQASNANLMEPTLQDVFIPTNPAYAIFSYDEERRFIKTLSIRNNSGEFKVIPTNYVEFRFEGKLNGDNVQGEVFFSMKPIEVQYTSTPIFHNIVNLGNTAIRYVDDPLSNEKILAQGSVFFYPLKHRGIFPFINELEQTCILTPQ